MNNMSPEEVPDTETDTYLYFELHGFCESDSQIANTLRDIANMIDDGSLKAKSNSVNVEKHNRKKIVIDSNKKSVVYYFVLENNPELNFVYN